jgi:hypothetical protein
MLKLSIRLLCMAPLFGLPALNGIPAAIAALVLSHVFTTCILSNHTHTAFRIDTRPADFTDQGAILVHLLGQQS